jgi:hypothetical protein
MRQTRYTAPSSNAESAIDWTPHSCLDQNEVGRVSAGVAGARRRSKESTK